MRRRVYIAGPMTKGDRLENIRQADRAMAELMAAGYSPFNPVLSFWAGNVTCDNTYGDIIATTGHEEEWSEFYHFSHADWLSVDKAWVAVADAVLRLPGESVGADEEVAFATQLRIPVFHSIDALRTHFEIDVTTVPGKRTAGWWDLHFLGLAEYMSRASKDPSTKVGCCIVDKDRRVVSTAFNGFARGCSDDHRLYADRDRKIRRVVHSEPNAIIFAKQDLTGCTIYTVPFMPCAQCAALIIQAGITRVVSVPCTDPARADRWAADMTEAREQFREAGVKLDLIG